jgi:hypothetical protein
MSELLRLDSQTSFSTVEGRLSGSNDRKTFALKLDKGNNYVFSASNFHPGEDLKLILKNSNGKTLAESSDSFGSEDPVLHFRAKRPVSARLLVIPEEDTDNRGEIPFSLSIKNEDHINTNTDSIDEVDLPGAESTSVADASLNQLFLNLSGDGITVSDLDKLLFSTTEDGSTVSQGELDELKNIASNLGTFVNDPALTDYYSYIFSAAIGDNPANRYWTGGVRLKKDRIDLGNLKVGSDFGHVALISRKWFRGEDLPLSRIDGDAANNKKPIEFSYSSASGPIFDADVNFDQVAQGHAGTCYFMAALMSVANSTPSLIRQMFIDNGDGTYGVRFFGLDGKSAWVTVNRELPVEQKGLVLAGSYRDFVGFKSSETNLLWAGLAEKALAQVNETGVLGRDLTENSYQAVEGGWGEPLDFITGLQRKETIPGFKREIGFNAFKDAVIDGRPVWLGSDAVWSSSSQRQLVKEHAYSVIDFNSNQKSFIVANPWGSEAVSDKPYDPVFAVPSHIVKGLFNEGSLSFAVL